MPYLFEVVDEDGNDVGPLITHEPVLQPGATIELPDGTAAKIVDFGAPTEIGFDARLIVTRT